MFLTRDYYIFAIQTDFVRLNYKSFGQGDPIIILHGLFGMLDNWQSVGKRLADNYHVILVDQRNHGKSFHSDEFSYELLATDLKDFMDELGLASAHIMGHSMGGKTAMTFASLFSSYLRSLIIVDIAPKQYNGGHEDIFKAILSIDIRSTKSRKEVDALLSQSISEQGVRLFLMKNLSRNPEGGYRWKANFEALHQHYPRIMDSQITGQFDKPSLFIKGGLSDYIVAEDEDQIREIFTNSEIQSVAGAGHWVHADRPLDLLEIVREFLQRDSI